MSATHWPGYEVLPEADPPPGYRPESSLDDVYHAIDDCQSALADLVILAQRHLPTEDQKIAEVALASVTILANRIMPEPDPEGPF